MVVVYILQNNNKLSIYVLLFIFMAILLLSSSLCVFIIINIFNVFDKETNEIQPEVSHNSRLNETKERARGKVLLVIRRIGLENSMTLRTICFANVLY